MTDTNPPAEDERPAGEDVADATGEEAPRRKRKSAAREFAVLVVLAVGLYYVMLTFVARPYLIPSESMEPTLHGCSGCVGDRIMVDKVTYRFGEPRPGDVVVFKGPPVWNRGYQSIRSDNPAIRWLQNALSVVGFVPPDENDLVKRVIAVGGQTVQCRNDTGLTVDGARLDEPYLDPETMGVSAMELPCLGPQFGPVTVPDGRLWVMGDNRTHSADSRAHCASPRDGMDRGIACTGDPESGTVPVENVIGKARFIAWPPGRWGGVDSVNPQQGA
ncbi:signal peptidase I [Mycobacterium sp. MYCO198283]|nr:signal peptidase I [Mycobacterium sp. MYCO198283]MCG5433742.1 signal peptidase I [Mycobacterium sp. MYCO198283]